MDRASLTERVVAAARGWIGTPYHHQMAVRGAGCDCLGLVRGVYAEIYGRPSETPPPYTPDWGDATGEETMIAAAGRHLCALHPHGYFPGDVLIFRMRLGAVAKHAAILATNQTIIHAFEHAPVCEVPLSPWWRRKIVAAFRFPDLCFKTTNPERA